jgi:hypothetical protein
MALVQTTHTEPYAGAIPDEEFNAGSRFVAKGIGCAITRGVAQGVLETLG